MLLQHQTSREVEAYPRAVPVPLPPPRGRSRACGYPSIGFRAGRHAMRTEIASGR